MVASASLLYRRITSEAVYLLAGLDKADTASVSLVHHINLTILLIAEHIEIMVNVIQSKHCFLNGNLLGQVVATHDDTKGKGTKY